MSVKYDKMVSVKMSTEQSEKLKEIAEAKQTSQGTIIRQWIEKEHQNLKEKKEWNIDL